MVKIVIELDLVSAAVADFAACKFSQNENDLLVSFLAKEVKQTSLTKEVKRNAFLAKKVKQTSLAKEVNQSTRHSSLVTRRSAKRPLVTRPSAKRTLTTNH